MESHNKDLWSIKRQLAQGRLEELSRLAFFCQEINTANGFLHLQALLHLARLDVPEPNRLVIAPADQALSPQQQRRAEVGVAMEETHALRERIAEVRLSVV